MSKEIAHTEEYKGYKINIYYSEDYDSPNDWGDDNLFLVYSHRQFDVRRQPFKPYEIAEYFNHKNNIEKLLNGRNKSDLLADEQEALIEEEDYLNQYYDYEAEYWVSPVEAFIHSGVTLSLFHDKKQCQWDSSVSGFIFAKRDEFPTEESAICVMESLIEEWNQYLSGEVYGFEVIKEDFCSHCSTTTEELIDSCSGYYGDYKESGCLDEARHVINNLTKDVVNG